MKPERADCGRAQGPQEADVLQMFCLSIGLALLPFKAQVEGLGELPPERDLYHGSPGVEPKGTIFDATNPMDLINRLRQANALDDAVEFLENKLIALWGSIVLISGFSITNLFHVFLFRFESIFPWIDTAVEAMKYPSYQLVFPFTFV